MTCLCSTSKHSGPRNRFELRAGEINILYINLDINHKLKFCFHYNGLIAWSSSKHWWIKTHSNESQGSDCSKEQGLKILISQFEINFEVECIREIFFCEKISHSFSLEQHWNKYEVGLVSAPWCKYPTIYCKWLSVLQSTIFIWFFALISHCSTFVEFVFVLAAAAAAFNSIYIMDVCVVSNAVLLLLTLLFVNLMYILCVCVHLDSMLFICSISYVSVCLYVYIL